MPTPLTFIRRFSNAPLVHATRKGFYAIAFSDRIQNALSNPSSNKVLCSVTGLPMAS
ncbi:MAG: hypothetical protein F6K65_22310 [Moorea sp. SIO3C2]|nr:hypothetical protein [Moorena sp. SIO3C2]